MLTHPTLEQMQALGLQGMAAAYRDMAEHHHTEEYEMALIVSARSQAASRSD